MKTAWGLFNPDYLPTSQSRWIDETCHTSTPIWQYRGRERNYIIRGKRKMNYLDKAESIGNLRNFHRLNIGILALAGSLSVFIFGNCTHVFASQTDAVSDEETEGILIDEDEEIAYRAAKKEQDPGKRAEKLFEFYQKYPESVLMQHADYEEIRMIVNAHNDYYAARNEPDVEKKSALLLEFLKKYPDSELAGYIDKDYMGILKELWQQKRYDLLESLSESWLDSSPDNVEALTFLADAAVNLLQFEKCGESLEAIYKIKPSPDLAREIYSCYQKSENMDKRVEWAGKLFDMDEFDDSYMLRYKCMTHFYEEDNIAKAAEYAQLTLKSAALAEKRDPNKNGQLHKVRRACYHIIASDLFDNDNFEDAARYYKEAVQAEPYAQGYYKIGLSLDNQKKIEEAMVYYAMADLVDRESAPNAKSRLETLYRALHNQTLIGIDKVYKKAEESLAGSTLQ